MRKEQIDGRIFALDRCEDTDRVNIQPIQRGNRGALEKVVQALALLRFFRGRIRSAAVRKTGVCLLPRRQQSG